MVPARLLCILLTVWLSTSVLGGLPVSAAAPERPAAFNLQLRLDSMSGPLLSTAITDGRLVTAQGVVPLLGGAGEPVLGNLIWQLYDDQGQPVTGHSKIRQILEVGGTEFVSFAINSSELANGVYYLTLTHQNAAQPGLASQASQVFEVKQPVAITRFLVDETTQGKEHRPVLYEDQSPHIFVYYHLAYDVPSVLIELDVYDSSGKRLATRSSLQDRDPSRKMSRFGIRLTPGLIPAGETAHITARLTAPDGSSAEQQVMVKIIGLQLQVDMPTVVKSGAAAAFRVMVPDTFVPPYQVSFHHEPSLDFRYQTDGPGELVGTLQVASSAPLGRQQVEIVVVDQGGRRASATADIRLEAGKRSSDSSGLPGALPPHQTGVAGGVGSSPPPF